MRLIQVDVVGLQPLQRIFHRLHHVFARQAFFAGPHLDAQLGSDNHRVPAAAGFQPVANDDFGLTAFVAGVPARINVGAIDEIEAARDERIEQGEGCILIGRPAEHVAAEGDRGDVQRGLPKLPLFHDGLLSCWQTNCHGLTRPPCVRERILSGR